MDFDSEAADDFRRAVKSWEDDLPHYLSRAGATSDDCESDNGLLTPPPDCECSVEKAWIVPPRRPTYADSWIRIMKKRVEDGCTSPTDQDSDTSSISSLSEDNSHRCIATYDLPVDIVAYQLCGSDDSDALAFSNETIDEDYKEGSTATTADAEDLLAEMLGAYTVPENFKRAIRCASSPKRKRSIHSPISAKSTAISKRSSLSKFRMNSRSRYIKT